MNVRELKTAGQTPGAPFQGFVGLLLNVKPRSTKTGNTYADAEVCDQDGNVTFRLWSNATLYAGDTKIQGFDALKEHVGSVVAVNGKTDAYNGRTQYVVDVMQVRKELDPNAYARSSGFSVNELVQELSAKIGEVSALDAPLGAFLSSVFSDPEFWNRFSVWPAAVSNHHDYRHGLLEHSMSVCRIADAIARSILGTDRALVIAGALLHDIGKLEAYSFDTPVPASTLAGSALNHVAPGYAMLLRLAEGKLSPDRTLALSHILLSHHGELTYGSPVVPATREAMIVSHADMLDFQTYVWTVTMEDVPGDVSEYNNHMKTRMLRLDVKGVEA